MRLEHDKSIGKLRPGRLQQAQIGMHTMLGIAAKTNRRVIFHLPRHQYHLPSSRRPLQRLQRLQVVFGNAVAHDEIPHPLRPLHILRRESTGIEHLLQFGRLARVKVNPFGIQHKRLRRD